MMNSTNPFDYAGQKVENRALISTSYPHGGRSMVDLPGRHGNIEIFVGKFKFEELTGSRMENMYMTAFGLHYAGVLYLNAWGLGESVEPYNRIGCDYIGYAFSQLDAIPVKHPLPEEAGLFYSLHEASTYSLSMRIDDEPMWHTHRLVQPNRTDVGNTLGKLLPTIGLFSYGREEVIADILGKLGLPE